MRNLDLLKSISSTKYHDWEGLIRADANDNSIAIHTLCRDNGIDIDSYVLVGFGIDDTDSVGKPTCTVLLADKERYGSALEHAISDEPVEVIKKTFKISYEEIAQAIKRLSIMTIWNKTDSDPTFLIQDTL